MENGNLALFKWDVPYT